jgi:hypothetical protein
LTLSRRARRFAAAAAVLWTVALAAGARTVWVRQFEGVELQTRAWKAAFQERGLTFPPHGPREGLWGSRLPPKTPHPRWRWREATLNLPPWVVTDKDGWQKAGPAGAPRRLAVVGGSVAFGACASTQEAAWFDRLARLLGERGFPAEVMVFAAGSWTSLHEERVVHEAVGAFKPVVLLVLDGLNDLTQAPEGAPGDERAARYLARVRSMRDWAAAHDVGFCAALQPFLPQKRRKTAWEEQILRGYPDAALYAGLYPRMREGLRALAAEGDGTLFIDVSGVFDREAATTFSDLWHFPDPGHDLLARALADALEPWWRARKRRAA